MENAKQIKQIAIKDLVPYEKKPAREWTCGSGGHTRRLAAQELGLEKVPVIVVSDLSEEKKKALRLADNKTSELAEWDEELLSTELDGILDLDMTDFGFEVEPELPPVEVQEDEYEEPEDLPSRARLGDVYRLGEHILMCGDSTNPADVGHLVGEMGTIDMVVTDPPYNVDYQGTAGNIQNDNMEDSKFLAFLTAAMENIFEALKPGGGFYIWHADFEGKNFRQACEDAGLPVKQCLIWVKNALVLGRQDYQAKHEPCLYGWRPGASHCWYGRRKETTTITQADMDGLKSKNKQELLTWIEEHLCTDDMDTSVLFEKRPTKADLHPTMKPILLIARLVRNSSQEGEKVLDLFGGSGTTLMACEQMGRKCRMMELDPHFVDVIIDRWETYTGLKAVKMEV